MASRLTRFSRLATPLSHSARSPAVFLPLQSRISVRYSSSDHPSNPFESMPSPPRLPPDQQAEFERLQRIANTQEGFNPTSTPDFSSLESASNTTSSVDGTETAASATEDQFASVPLRKGAPPEFEGDVNPKTGEVGGPKNEPLRWGATGDYSFNGRVTDF
ncbi:hypothetical protein M426DRAFT_11186 [Hypoxylon sp. CI-4A]|nr:hypothetical protein M426DRAFT_11186 [Hypoxylon sp. CI-4A]